VITKDTQAGGVSGSKVEGVVAGKWLAVWKSLPESVRSAETLATFKRQLKTYLFNISFLFYHLLTL